MLSLFIKLFILLGLCFILAKVGAIEDSWRYCKVNIGDHENELGSPSRNVEDVIQKGNGSKDDTFKWTCSIIIKLV